MVLYSRDADTRFLWRGIFESVSVTSYHAVRARLEWTKIFRNLTKMDARNYLPVSRTKSSSMAQGDIFCIPQQKSLKTTYIPTFLWLTRLMTVGYGMYVQCFYIHQPTFIWVRTDVSASRRVMPMARTVAGINRFSRSVNRQHTKCIPLEYTLYTAEKIA